MQIKNAIYLFLIYNINLNINCNNNNIFLNRKEIKYLFKQRSKYRNTQQQSENNINYDIPQLEQQLNNNINDPYSTTK